MLRCIAVVVIGVIAFVAISELSQSYRETLQLFIEQVGVPGILSYIGIMILSIVVAPIGTGFLFPVAANAWGPISTALYSIIGWTIGAMIAFFLSRKTDYGL